MPLFSRSKRGELRVSPPVYRLLLATHIIVSVGWLGIVVAKLVLGLRAVTLDAPEVSDALYASMEVVDAAFPPAAVATLVTGVLLSLGTKWSLLRHYWIVTKLGLTVGVIVTGIALMDRLVRGSISGQAVGDPAILSLISAPTTFLISLSVAHVLMLGVATVVSVYKPWGKTRFGRYKALSASNGSLPRDEILYSSIVSTEPRRHNRA
jgi:hypothetical protein